MDEKIIKILEDNFTDSIEFDREKAKEELLILFGVSVSFNDGYEKGWSEATTEACKEIAKNYQPNER